MYDARNTVESLMFFLYEIGDKRASGYDKRCMDTCNIEELAYALPASFKVGSLEKGKEWKGVRKEKGE